VASPRRRVAHHALWSTSRGRVTLTGPATYAFQREEASMLGGRTAGLLVLTAAAFRTCYSVRSGLNHGCGEGYVGRGPARGDRRGCKPLLDRESSSHCLR